MPEASANRTVQSPSSFLLNLTPLSSSSDVKKIIASSATILLWCWITNLAASFRVARLFSKACCNSSVVKGRWSKTAIALDHSLISVYSLDNLNLIVWNNSRTEKSPSFFNKCGRSFPASCKPRPIKLELGFLRSSRKVAIGLDNSSKLALRGILGIMMPLA